jgi:hypothetical protein
MARNRTIYNVQDLFFGLASGETNFPAVPGYEIIKRIHRVQNVNYDLQVSRTDVGLLGKSSYDESVVTSPPDVSFNFTYYLEGLNNEKKMGFNVLTSGSSTNPYKEFTYDFVTGNKQQNIYLAVKKDGSDLKDPAVDPSEIPGLIALQQYDDIGHQESTGMGLITFQNCYINNYALDVSIGSYPKVDIGVTADNVVYNDTASGLYPPILNTQTAEQEYRSEKLLVPKNYTRENPHFDVNRTFRPSDANVTIQTRPSPADVLVKKDFEDGVPLTNYATATQSIVTNPVHDGLKALKIVAGSSKGGGGNYGGASFSLPDSMVVGEYYTISIAAKVSAAYDKRIWVSVQNGNGDENSLSFSFLADHSAYSVYKHKVKLDVKKSTVYIFTQTQNLTFYLDDIQVYKDADKDPIKFHIDDLQSLKLNVPLPRENMACLGHKYYTDRSLTLPIKTSMALDFLVNKELTGDFLDNLRKDEEYDVNLDFRDSVGNEMMKMQMGGLKFENAAYSSAIGDNKTASLNFSMSNDYDYGRNVITADGRGLYILDYLVDDNLSVLTDDQGSPMQDTTPHLF